MKTILLFILLFVLASCFNKRLVAQDTPEDSSPTEYATYYIVVADTGTNYFDLHKKMFELTKKLSIEIDTMGRTYDAEKDLIALAIDDSDEIYAGDYLPRRYPSESLSLEYLDLYQNNAGHKTIALVSGIYEEEKLARLALQKLKKECPKAFKIKTEMFIGCLH